MDEVFPKPGVAAIIEKKIGNENFLLIQTRQKSNGGNTNGLIEIPAGKVREYESVYDALRREVMEETGLTITKIRGEETASFVKAAQGEIMAFEPFCVTQNLSGIYSIILNTFICEATGESLGSTDEATGIHWEKACEVKRMLETRQDSIFPMHIFALRKYFNR